MVAHLDPEIRRWLHPLAPAEREFAVQVALQAARAGREGGAGAAAERVAALLAPGHPVSPGERARALLSDPPLLAAVFQNLDLLHARHSPRADEVSRWRTRPSTVTATSESRPPDCVANITHRLFGAKLGDSSRPVSDSTVSWPPARSRTTTRKRPSRRVT